MTPPGLCDLTLAINAGSSSLKFASYCCTPDTQIPVQRAAVEDIGHPTSRLWVSDDDTSLRVDRTVRAADHSMALSLLLDETRRAEPVVAVGHRIVYGGPTHRHPEPVTPAVLRDLDALVDRDPLHLPATLAVIRSARAALPDACHVGCFDTAFHRTMPAVAARYPLPEELWTAGIRRFGFHGLVAESVVDSLPDAGRLVIAHLGSGVSITAVLDGRGVDTTMGFTPSGGVMMGTRPGDLDPGVLVHLLEHEGYDSRRLRRLISQRSGLLAVSGTTQNMRDLLGASPTDERASLAVDMFCYQVSKAIGAMAAVLEGIDTLVFSGGIGERSPEIRSRVAAPLGYCGIHLDDDRNAGNSSTISPDHHGVDVRVVAADEERIIARHAERVLAATRTR